MDTRTSAIYYWLGVTHRKLHFVLWYAERVPPGASPSACFDIHCHRAFTLEMPCMQKEPRNVL